MRPCFLCRKSPRLVDNYLNSIELLLYKLDELYKLYKLDELYKLYKLDELYKLYKLDELYKLVTL